MRKPNKTHIKNALFFILGSIAIIMGALVLWVSTMQLPDFSSFDSRKEVNSTKIYDRTGTIVLYDLNNDTKRTTIPYTEMGDNIKKAVVAIEDSNFYNHIGIEPKALLRAFIADVTHTGVVQGGSTITQQVIKKSMLSDDKTITRKIKEIVLALKLERSFTKAEILGIYLNEIPYGGSVFGIQEASQTFLGKDPKDLTIAEAAYLASIPNAPTHYSPYGNNRADLDARKNLVLSREKTLGVITAAEYNQAKAEKVVFKTQQSDGIKAPHFVFYVKDYLEQKYGADVVESGGLKVITTLDYGLQQIAEKAVTEYTTGTKKQLDDLNAGLVAIDPKTGQILTMVGSRNYFDKQIDGNFNVTLARRQPGSSFKPYMYVTAFEKGYTPSTVLMDVPTEFNASCDPYGNPYPGTNKSECYMPVNYDDKYHGPMDIRTAIGSSMNIPAIKMLYMIGMKDTIKTAQDMGITTLTDPSRYGLTLVIGGGEVRLLEAVSAYGTFADEGVRHPYSSVLSVQDKDGKTLESWQDNPIPVLQKNAVLQLDDVLSDNNARRLTFAPNSPLYFPDHQVAVKTGTTNDYKDLWTIGYTPSIVAGVWAGKNDDTAMRKGITVSPIWHEFMAEALKKYPNETFEKPAVDPNYMKLPPVLRGHFEGEESYNVDTISGKLATDLTPALDIKTYVSTDVHDILHWINRDDPTNPVPPTNPEKESLYNNWETAVQDWWKQNWMNYPVVTDSQKPTAYDDVHTPANMPVVVISSPTDSYSDSEKTPITVNAYSNGPYKLKKIDVFLNNTYVGSSSDGSTIFRFTPEDVPGVIAGNNILKVVGTDTIDDQGTATENINLSSFTPY